MNSTIYELNQNVIIKDMGEELIVMNEVSEEILGVSGCGAEIIKVLDKFGKMNEIEINNKIIQNYVIEENVFYDSLIFLMQNGLIYER